ncbi:charged multivesicular body protein 1a-like [Sorex fumeus]|uniref:charged multivesicular body protein 1a-like n=1 Tax=Sorex fumeus TaxID=62283 RepID=UPI0024ACCBCB|nr:charged multivesicular body protein 1a-like [Sorex fumeus]
MDDHPFQLKYTVEQLQQLAEIKEELEKLAEKAENDFKAEKAKADPALKKKNGEFARMYAEIAISMKKEWLKWVRMASWVYTLASKVQTGLMVKEVSQNMQDLTIGLEKVVTAKGVKKISAAINKFEQLVENLDASVMEDSTSSATRQERVDRFLQEITEEIKREEDRDQLSQLSKVPSPVGESSKGIGQN